MIVNLQETPHDGAAALVVRARVDAVMERLCAALGVAELAAMRPGAGIVSYSRAAVIDYESVRVRCEAGEISAILDVFDPEPLPADSPRWHTPNAIITPHCSSDDTDVYIPKTLDHVLANMRRFRAGEPLENRVDPVLEY